MLIKICGLRSQQDADAAIGADFCGFIFHQSSPRAISPEDAARIQTANARRVGVFVKQDAVEILRIMRIANLHFAQLHGPHDRDCAMAIGADKIIRVLWPERFRDIGELQHTALTFADSCAFFLLDAGSDGGGSGRKLDCRNFANLDLPRPWLLAGGLDAENIDEALKVCAPAGLDFNSRLEDSPGIKNPARIRQAVIAAQAIGKAQ